MKIISMVPEAEDQQTKTTDDLAITDPNHLLYLHHSDHPTYVLSTQLLNEDNYHHWKRSVEVSLEAKNKLQFVTGDSKKPEEGSVQSMQWRRCNSMVTSWLLHSVEKDIAETLLYYETAAEIWTDLKLRFGQTTGARIYQVQKDIFNVSQGNLSVTSYFTKFRKIWDEYLVLVEMPKCTSCGKLNTVPQMLLNQQVLQFLVGLNDNYSAVRANILMMKPTPPLGEAFQMVDSEEKQRSLNNNSSVSTNDSSAFHVFPRLTQGPGNQSQNSQNQGQRGAKQGPNQVGSSGNQTANNTNASNNNNSGQKGKPYYYCEHCKREGHSIQRCFKINGYPKDRKKFAGSASTSQDGAGDNTEKAPSLTKEQYDKLLALLARQQVGGGADDRSCMMAGPFSEHASGAW